MVDLYLFKLQIFVTITDGGRSGELHEVGPIFIPPWWHCIFAVFFWAQDFEGGLDYFWQLDRTSSSQSLKKIVTSTVRFILKSIQMCGELWVPDNPQFQVTLYQQKGTQKGHLELNDGKLESKLRFSIHSRGDQSNWDPNGRMSRSKPVLPGLLNPCPDGGTWRR